MYIIGDREGVGSRSPTGMASGLTDIDNSHKVRQKVGNLAPLMRIQAAAPGSLLDGVALLGCFTRRLHARPSSWLMSSHNGPTSESVVQIPITALRQAATIQVHYVTVTQCTCRKYKLDVTQPEASPYRRLSVLITGDHHSYDRSGIKRHACLLSSRPVPVALPRSLPKPRPTRNMSAGQEHTRGAVRSCLLASGIRASALAFCAAARMTTAEASGSAM
jgi:hypothetical protein